jgi:hypothetical protein
MAKAKATPKVDHAFEMLATQKRKNYWEPPNAEVREIIDQAVRANMEKPKTILRTTLMEYIRRLGHPDVHDRTIEGYCQRVYGCRFNGSKRP